MAVGVIRYSQIPHRERLWAGIHGVYTGSGLIGCSLLPTIGEGICGLVYTCSVCVCVCAHRLSG